MPTIIFLTVFGNAYTKVIQVDDTTETIKLTTKCFFFLKYAGNI